MRFGVSEPAHSYLACLIAGLIMYLIARLLGMATSSQVKTDGLSSYEIVAMLSIMENRLSPEDSRKRSLATSGGLLRPFIHNCRGHGFTT